MTLRVILEIIPQGEEGKAKEIGRLDIYQKGKMQTPDGKELDGICAYGVVGYDDETFVHDRSDGAWRLVQNVLFTLAMKGLKGPKE